MADHLDRLVRENRFMISVIFPLVGALGFILSAESLLPVLFTVDLQSILGFNPYLIFFGTLVMRLPLIAGLETLADRKMISGIAALGIYSYLIEYIGLRTGWPYGDFKYLIDLGPAFMGVPLGLPVFFIPLVINSYLLMVLLGVDNRIKRFLLSLGTVMLIDTVLDPAMVALGIWEYSTGGFYGVPVTNFVGWMISGAVALIVLELVLETDRIEERIREAEYMLDDMVSFVFLWGFVNLYYMNTVPVIGSLMIGYGLYRTDRFSFAFEGVLESYVSTGK